MRVVSFRNKAGDTRIGIRLGERIADLTGAFEKLLVEEKGVGPQSAMNSANERMPSSMLSLIAREEEGMADLKETAEYLNRMSEKGQTLYSPGGYKIIYGLEEVRLLKPVPEIARVLNIGANYNAYLSMMEFVQPYEGTAELFMKLPQAVIGPEEEIKWPISAKEVCCEIELGVVVGKKGKRISQAEALDYVFGYTVVNDVTAIDIIKRGLGKGREGLPGFFYATLAKTPDSFEPMGPCITLKDEIPDPQGLNGELRVNGELRARGNTSDMRLTVTKLIEFLSQDITLYPGDLISTGAMGTDEYPPHVYLKPGDIVELELEKIGVLRNYVAT